MNDEEVIPDEESEFYFESDHLALKGNKDYSAFLKTIVTLEAQRAQAIRDLDELKSVRSKAMEDPIAFVAQLQNGDHPELPCPQTIVEIPHVIWSQYDVGSSDTRLKPYTRHKHASSQAQQKNEQENGKIFVRGRAFDESKPETFNQLWTVEEQRRLEELLIEYPPEEVEMRRWTKIAHALGNRTPKQVSSRVQKYFIKLGKAGLPIPGRGPKQKFDIKRGSTHRHQRNNHFLFKRSTFFPHHDVSFNILEEKGQLIGEEYDTADSRESDSNLELRYIDLLHQVKTEKQQDPSSLYKHIGYKCTVCGEEPLRGTRWHCAECYNRVDLCGDCAVAQLEAENPAHDLSHRLIPIKSPQSIKSYDQDYLPQSFSSSSSYNYLDPNFLCD